MSCPIATKEVKQLTIEFPEETIESMKGLVGIWQDENNSPEEYPIVEEVNILIDKLRNTQDTTTPTGEEVSNMLDEALSPSFNVPNISTVAEQAKVDLDFDPKTRRDRVTLIARFFRDEVDKAVEEMKSALKKRMDSASAEERVQLQKNLDSLTRIKAIETYTPSGLFNRVLDIFKSYVNDTEEARIQAELIKINSSKGADKYSDGQKLIAAKKKAIYKEQAYRKIIDNFKPLAEEACTFINIEGVSFSLSHIATKKTRFTDDTPEGYSELDKQTDEFSKEENFKDSWVVNYRNVSSRESLSQAVRTVLEQIPKLDYRGKFEKDDLGFQKYLDADFAHAVFIDKLRNMVTSDDMIPLMQELVKNQPWVKQVIELLQKDEALFSQFYQDFRKDFTAYWIQKKKLMPDGSYRMQTISINQPEGVYYLLDFWRGNYESGTQLDDDSVYKQNGELNLENAGKGLKLVETLNTKFSNLDTETRLALLEDAEVWNTILKLLNMVGINADSSLLRNALTNIKTSDTVKQTDPVMLLLQQLNIIFSGINKNKIKTEIKEDGTEAPMDLINIFGSAYNVIANMMAIVTEDAVESSVRENDKSYYSHTNPNYLGKLIKQLKNVGGDMERFKEFMETEFRQYEWFFKNGRWRNDWLEQLANSEKMRKGLSHKVVLNSDKVKYSDWNDLDYTLALLTEYWGDPENTKTSIQWAWYHVPLLSDSPSAEFIRFRKYISGVEYDAEGNKLSYEDIILDKLTDLVNQEYDRIMLVLARDEKLQEANPGISPIANFDISRDKEGKITNIGGAEFKFLTALNSIIYDDGQTFLDRLGRLSKEGNGAELKSFIRETLKEVMDNGFEETYREWSKIGLLDEVSNNKYKYLPFAGQSLQNSYTVKSLAKAKEILGTTLWTNDMEMLLKDYSNNNPMDDRITTTIFEQIKNIMAQKVALGTITESEFKSVNRNLEVRNRAKEALREYYWNSTLATSQIIQLTTTDLAFYKNLEDTVKRYKQIHSPALRLNTKATYKGERIGRDWEKTVYLKDEEIASTLLSDIQTVLDERVEKGEMSKIDRDNILYKFKSVNVADAQAYRSLSSYRAILGMSGQWTDEMERAYNNFKEGTWNIADFNIIWQTKKPFVYTQINNKSGIEGHTGIKTPVQHKNSEFLLLAMHELIAGPFKKSNKLRAINEFMEKYNIDVVQFESTTKVGKQGVINLNTKFTLGAEQREELDSKLNSGEITQEQYNKVIKENTVSLSSYEDIMAVLKKATGLDKGTENPDVVHKISYEDYGIQVETPEHAIDAFQLVGTQLRKLITADISPDTIIEVGNQKMTKQEWLDLYNAINTENILQAFKEVDDMFEDPKKIEEALIEEIKSSPRYGMDLIRACTLDENGHFNIPLFDPIQSQRIQTLLNSIIKSRVTKQKIRGGALIQVSDYGLTDELNIVFKNKQGELMTKKSYFENHPNASEEDYNKFIEKSRAEGSLSIAYFECFMPAYSTEFYKPLMKEGTHELDIAKLPDSLRKLIGYRVPTEDKYSMAPLYIKGFLPQQNGSAIMLPAEITTLSGSDFDIDKLYIMLSEFNINKIYDIKKAWEDFYADPSNADIVEEIDKNLGIAFADYQKRHPEDADIDFDDYWKYIKDQGVQKYQLSETAQTRFTKWFKSRKSKYDNGKRNITRIEYDFNKTPQENGLKARNNLLIDMMWGVLTNSDTASKILNPGGFDYQKRSARIINILTSNTESDLRTELGINRGPVLTKLLEMDLESLDRLAERSKRNLNLLSPRTQVLFHQQIMTGIKLIGIFATHNANHALMQHTKLGLNQEYGSFVLNGKRLTSLHNIMNLDKEFISKNNAGFLAASVDNAKDPVLADMNINTFTANVAMLLSRLGYNPIEIGLLLAQPIVKEITQTYFIEVRQGKSQDIIIDEILEKYQKKADVIGAITYDSYENNKFLIEDLAYNILIEKEMGDITSLHQTSDYSKVEFYKNQLAVGFLFRRMMKSAESLNQLVQAIRADTGNGAAGPTIADTIVKIQKVKDFLEGIEKDDKFPLEGAEVIKEFIKMSENHQHKGEAIDILRKELLNSDLPYLQAFFTLGVQHSERLFAKYFPHFTVPFMEVITALKDITKFGKLDVKTMNSIYNDLLAYIMSKTEFFGAESDWSKIDEMGQPINRITSEEKRRTFINDFPTYFNKIVSENEDIANLEFIKRLKFIRANATNPVNTIIFKNVGHLSSTLRERYTRDWASLLYMKNPEAQKLALNLFKYNFYRNGFAFGPSTFIHLAPVAVRKAIPEYVETLESLLTSKDDYKYFVEQYVYNHLDNRKLVPEIPKDASTSFVNEKGEFKDEVTFIIDENSNSGDKKAVKQKIDTPIGPMYDFCSFIAYKVKGEYAYYRLSEWEVLKPNVAVYKRIQPLGLKNKFIEYEYGQEVEAMTSVIKEPTKKYNHRAVFEDFTSFETPEITEEDSVYLEMSKEAFNLDVADRAYEYFYDTPRDKSIESDNDLMSIEPNIDFKDANDDQICGANFLKDTNLIKSY